MVRLSVDGVNRSCQWHYGSPAWPRPRHAV